MVSSQAYVDDGNDGIDENPERVVDVDVDTHVIVASATENSEIE